MAMVAVVAAGCKNGGTTSNGAAEPGIEAGEPYLGLASALAHNTPEEWAANHVALGLKSIVFPVDCNAGEEKIQAYKKAADDAGLMIAEVGVWRNTLAKDPQERQKWIDYAVEQLKMADRIGAVCCVNVVGTPYGPRWDGAYKENFSAELWDMAVKMIQEIIDRAQPKNAKYCIEPMPWMIPSTPEECLKLVEDVDRPQFGVHMDIVNIITSPEKYFFNDKFLDDCFALLGDKICSCHLKDIRLKEEFTFQLEECACGEGTLDIARYIKLATSVNPKMPMIIEHLNSDEQYIKTLQYVQSLQ